MKTFKKGEEAKKSFNARPPESDSDNSEGEYIKQQADAEYFNEKKDDCDSDQELLNDSTKRPQGTGAAAYMSTTFNSNGKIGFKPHAGNGISKGNRPDKREKAQKKRQRKMDN